MSGVAYVFCCFLCIFSFLGSQSAWFSCVALSWCMPIPEVTSAAVQPRVLCSSLSVRSTSETWGHLAESRSRVTTYHTPSLDQGLFSHFLIFSWDHLTGTFLRPMIFDIYTYGLMDNGHINLILPITNRCKLVCSVTWVHFSMEGSQDFFFFKLYLSLSLCKVQGNMLYLHNISSTFHHPHVISRYEMAFFRQEMRIGCCLILLVYLTAAEPRLRGSDQGRGSRCPDFQDPDFPSKDSTWLGCLLNWQFFCGCFRRSSTCQDILSC